MLHDDNIDSDKDLPDTLKIEESNATGEDGTGSEYWDKESLEESETSSEDIRTGEDNENSGKGNDHAIPEARKILETESTPPSGPSSKGDGKHTELLPTAPLGYKIAHPFYPPHHNPSAPGRRQLEMLKRATMERKRANPPLAFPIAMMVVLGILGTIFIHGVVSTSADEDEEIIEGMRIEEVFFILAAVDEESITVDINIYITNTGNKDSGEINITALAENQKNRIVYAQGSAIIPKIEDGKTDKAVISMSFGRNESFKISIIIFEDRFWRTDGYGEITTGMLEQNAEDFVTEGNGGVKNDLSDSDEGKAFMAAEGSSIVCFIGLIPILAIILFTAARKRGWC